MAKRIIVLEERKQLKVFMSPVRQEIIRLLRLSEEPLTAKALADRLCISPSSVQHHLKKLEDLGVVEVDHQAQVNGITATYYRDANAEVRLHLSREDGFQGEREALAANLVDGVFRGFLAASYRHGAEDLHKYGALLSGVLHLRPEDRAALMETVGEYIATHDTAGEETTEHWEYVVLAYRAGEEL